MALVMVANSLPAPGSACRTSWILASWNTGTNCSWYCFNLDTNNMEGLINSCVYPKIVYSGVSQRTVLVLSEIG